MKKKNKIEHEHVCGLCEYACYMEYDEKIICKYKKRCTVVEDTDSCRRFKLDLLKLAPPPKLPYKADEAEILLIPAGGETESGLA